MTDRTQLPVACTLNEPDLAERRAGLFTDLARRRHEARWLAEGITCDTAQNRGHWRYWESLSSSKAIAARSCVSSLRSSPGVAPSGSS